MNIKKFIILILALIMLITLPFIIDKMNEEKSLKVDKGRETEFFGNEEGKLPEENTNKSIKINKDKGEICAMSVSIGKAALSSGGKTFNYKAAKKKNKSCKGAIYIPGTKIMFPIVKAKNNTYYLNHTFYKNQSARGAIFMDCNLSFKDTHTMIYGHNLRNGDMFSALTKYASSKFAKKHQKVIIWIKGKKHTYKVFSSHKSKPQSKQTYRITYPNKKAYAKWLKKIKKKSNHKYKYKPKKSRKTITLSTCSSHSIRQVVHLQRVKY